MHRNFNRLSTEQHIADLDHSSSMFVQRINPDTQQPELVVVSTGTDIDSGSPPEVALEEPQ